MWVWFRSFCCRAFGFGVALVARGRCPLTTASDAPTRRKSATPGERVPPGRLWKIFQKIDVNGDQRMDIHEFKDGMQARMRLDTTCMTPRA